MKSNPFEDPLNAARQRFGRLGTSFHFFPAIGSTNDYATSIGSEGAVVVADTQTAGRGRRGHSWFSPPASGLYVSIVMTPSRAASDPLRAATLVTLMAGVAIAEGVDAASGLCVGLKWPNDLFVQGRKLGGILSESSSSSESPATVTVGYGINVAATSFPADLRDRATSLESELGRPVERAHVLVETLAALAVRYEDLLTGRFDAILDGWRRRAPAAAGARVRWTSSTGEQTGTTAGIDGNGALLVRTDDNRTERIISGELLWL